MIQMLEVPVEAWWASVETAESRRTTLRPTREQPMRNLELLERRARFAAPYCPTARPLNGTVRPCNVIQSGVFLYLGSAAASERQPLADSCERAPDRCLLRPSCAVAAGHPG